MVEVEDWFFWVNILNFESYSMLWFAQKSGDLLWENVSFFEGWENVSLTTFCLYTLMWHYGKERVGDKIGKCVGATSPRVTFVCES